MGSGLAVGKRVGQAPLYGEEAVGVHASSSYHLVLHKNDGVLKHIYINNVILATRVFNLPGQGFQGPTVLAKLAGCKCIIMQIITPKKL